MRALPKSADSDVALILWQRLAAELIVVIGDRGFASLYWRSLNEASAEFDWLEPHLSKSPADAFPLLASIVATRTPEEAHAANAAVLNIFIDTLIILIGELVTNSILQTAWGTDIMGSAGTEHRT